jgi:hypothetical protein
MTGVFKGLDLVIDIACAAAWGFGGYVVASRLISDQAAGLLGLGVFLSVLAYTLGTHLHELQMRRLVAGVCPRCRKTISVEHRHRRWEPARSDWLPPMTSWQCAACGYGHSESWPCPTCPAEA